MKKCKSRADLDAVELPSNAAAAFAQDRAGLLGMLQDRDERAVHHGAQLARNARESERVRVLRLGCQLRELREHRRRLTALARARPQDCLASQASTYPTRLTCFEGV